MLLIDKCRQLVKKWRAKDPVYSCEVYKSEGCAHVDNPLCDMKTCTIRFEWMSNESDAELISKE